MTKVVSLNGAALPGERPEEVVETLRELLGRAESGEISAIAVAYVVANGQAGTVFAGGGKRYALGGAVLALQSRYGAFLLGGG